MSEQLIPGADPGACPRCGQWRMGGMTHECVPLQQEDMGIVSSPPLAPDRFSMTVTDQPTAVYWRIQQGDGTVLRRRFETRSTAEHVMGLLHPEKGPFEVLGYNRVGKVVADA